MSHTTIGHRLSTCSLDELMAACEPKIPTGSVRCTSCDSSGTHTYGYRDGQPIEDRCPHCHGFGVMRSEAARIDAEKAAHEATLPDYIALSHEAIFAGGSPF